MPRSANTNANLKRNRNPSPNSNDVGAVLQMDGKGQTQVCET